MLNAAAAFGTTELLNYLLSHEVGAPVNWIDGEGRMAVHMARISMYWAREKPVELSGHKSTMFIFHKWRDLQGRTALQFACGHENMMIIWHLLGARNLERDFQKTITMLEELQCVPKFPPSFAETRSLVCPSIVSPKDQHSYDGSDHSSNVNSHDGNNAGEVVWRVLLAYRHVSTVAVNHVHGISVTHETPCSSKSHRHRSC